MKLKTKYFGEIEVKEEEIFHFPNGIPGFESVTDFVLINIDEEGLYQSLQSVQDPTISLVIANPYLFFKDYEFTLDDQSLDLLEIQDKEQVLVYSVLTIKEPFNKTTANLQAPIILNHEKRIGKQLILNQSPYKTKHLILGEGDVDART